MTKNLAVFDFDHTIVDDNSDIVARKLLRVEDIPDSVKHLYRSSGWTCYMQEIFKLLHKHKIPEQKIKEAIINVPAVSFMGNLIQTMVTKLNYDVIVISDSNSVFIDDWLRAHGLKQFVKKVFTNPACYKDGLLTIEMYHHQETCKLSTVNLCKGMIMEDFIQKQKKIGVEYEKVVYAGDGHNDYCPILRLRKDDVACVRKDYACAKMIEESKTDSSHGTVRAKICIWSSGQDILKFIS